MNIGVCTTDYDRMPMQQLFDLIEQAGYTSIQLSFDSISECGFEATGEIEIPAEVDPAVLEQIRSCAAQHGLQILCVNGTFNMAHPDANVREDGVRRFEGFARAVKALGARYISLCTGTRNREHLWRPHEENQTESAWQDMADSMRKIVDIAEKLDLVLLIETEASNVVDTPEKASVIMQQMGSEHLKIVMDCANLFHVGQAHPSQVGDVIGHAFDVLGQDVCLAHGKDIAEGDGISFCPTGEGIVDFDLFLGLLSKYGYQGDMLLHGIYDMNKMRSAREWMENRIADASYFESDTNPGVDR